MKIGNAGFELADLRAEQERDHGIGRARYAVRRTGGHVCTDCGEAIEPERRDAAPFAIRCIDCQIIYERGA